MHRYLLNISYIGTRFRGIQRSVTKDSDYDPKSVQGVIEIGLKKLNPINKINLALSSRTDTGVHALNTTVHVDLEKPNGLPYNPIKITQSLNKTFELNKWDVRVINTTLIPDSFHCRFNAKYRTYLYRIAVRKSHLPYYPEFKKQIYFNYISIEEFDRCLFIQNPVFDIDKVHGVLQLFRGRHDFRTFMGSSRQDLKVERPTFAWREILDISITPGYPIGTYFGSQLSNDTYDYWDIKVTGKSFVYRQIRRIVGTLITLAQGRITTQDVYEMLTIPSKNSWISQISVAMPHGLYLCEVGYDQSELENAINKKLIELRTLNLPYYEFLTKILEINKYSRNEFSQ